MTQKNSYQSFSPEVSRALKLATPVVALESTVITHGLPRPRNLELARDMEREVREAGATPATIALLHGEVHIGLRDEELIELVETKSPLKISHRDFATAILQKASGGTTVAGTIFAAHAAGIRVFATGGIGGVHRESPFDISNDLQALSGTPMLVVCAGAKAILDLAATLEYLETMGVPVVGYRTDEFPAFYSRESGLGVSVRLDSPEEIARFAETHWKLGLRSAVVVTNPLPISEAIPKSEMDPLIDRVSREAREKGIHGQGLTPFLLRRLSELTQERSLRANLSLLLNNARLAAQIASVMASKPRIRSL
jgi:pseudouridine-5'-phosphate glycosidase